MSTRIKDTILPIAYEDFDMNSVFVTFYDVIFTEDFKDIKKDSNFTHVTMDYTTGDFRAYNDDGDIPAFTYKLKFI